MAHSNRQKSPIKVPKFGSNSILDHSENDKIFQVLQEMFHGKVEPEVVHMILTEMDWKVDKAIDTLLTFCGEGGNIDRKKSRLHKMAQEILCKNNDESTDVRSALQQCEARHELASPKSHVTLPPKSHEEDMPPLSKSTVLSDHAIASNSASSTVGLERRRVPPASSSPLQQIRSVMASTYGRTQEVKDKGHAEEQPTINPLSVDDDIHTDSNLISQSILSGALHLSGTEGLSELYNPFSDATVKESDLYQDSYKAYMDNYWPDITAKFGIKTNKDMAQNREINHQSQRDATNIFPGMYTESDDKKKSMVSQSNGVQSSSDESDKVLKEKVKGEANFPRTGIGSNNISMLVRLGLAEKNERGQLKNLQKDPEEDLDLNFNMETFDLENDDSSSDGSILSQSGSAETIAAELKNMLGISKEEKKEPSMLESAARELERLNALSPNAKEFIPRSTNVQSNTIDSKPFDAFPKFLTPKAALPTQQRTLPPYAMFPPQQQGQHPQIRPVPMFPVPRHIPFNPQIPVVPVTLVGVRNMPPQPPPPMNIMPQTSQVGPLIQTTNMMHRPSTLMPPPGLVPISSPTRNMLHHPMSSPSPPILPYASAFPSPTAQQLASEAQQYATIAAQQMTKKVQTQSKESSPSPPERSLDLCSQKVKDKIMSGVRVFIILRGLPGSGKSTLARELKENGEIFSADDYFMNGDVYCYDQRKLTDAHDHCRRRALEAVRKNVSPVIIDNTNTQVWEMCPYVDIAKSVTPEYEIEILEPSTPWRFKARQCAEKSDHAVPYESIKRMLDRYQRNVTVDMLINTKSRSRPVTILPQNNIKETETKTAKKSSTETKNNSSSYNVDDNEDIWQDVGSFKWKNYYQPLMNEQEEEKDENEDLKDEEFPALKSNDKRKSQVENKSSKHTERKDKKRPETKENMSQEDEAGSKNGNAVMVDNSNVTDRIDEHAVASTGSMSSEKLVNKNNMLPFSTGLGFQMNKHKGLSTANLQKQIELISQQKLLVSEKTCASPVTVQPEQSENTLIQNRSSRTPSFEKGRSEDKEFSDEIHELVDSLMSEHVEDKTISDLSKVQDELKAYLHIMPIDEQQRQDAECLIDQKLSMFLHNDKTSDSDMQHVQEPFNLVEQNDNKENEKVHQDTNLPNMSSATDIVDGRFNIESSFPSELNNVEDNQNQTISVTDEDQTIGSIELSLEKVFDVIDEKPERESENLNDSEGVDLNVNKSGKVVDNEIWSTDQLKGQGHDENWDNNGKTEQADEAQGSFNKKELEMKHIEKEYLDSKSSVIGTNSSLQYGLNSKNNPVKLEDKSENQIDAVTEQLNDLSDDCLGEKFWDVDSDGEKDTEKKYWKNEKPSEEKDQQVKSSHNSDSQVKSSNESDTQPKSFDKSDSLLKTSNKLDTENKIESTDSKFEKESSPNVWEEPKTKRQRKRNNRDKNKQKDNVNSNENEVLNEAIQSKQNNEPESEISSKASVKNNEDQQTDLSSKAAVKSSENQQKTKTRKNKSSKTSGQIKEAVSLKKSSQLKQVPSTKICDNHTNSPDQSDPSSANQISSSKSNSSKTHDNHHSTNSSEKSKQKAAIDLKNTDSKSVGKKQKKNQKPNQSADTVKNEKSDEKGNLKPSVCLSDGITVDKPSFLVQHFNDRLDGECIVLNTTSLLSLKKAKVELTIDSDMVQNRLEDDNFKQKLQRLEDKTDSSSITVDKQKDNNSDVDNSDKHKFIIKENLNPELSNAQPDIVKTDSKNKLEENPSTDACRNNLEKPGKKDSQPTVSLTDHNQGNDECSKNVIEKVHNNDLHKKDKNAELVASTDTKVIVMEANQQIKSREGNDSSLRHDIAKVNTEELDKQQVVGELYSGKPEETTITQTPVSQDTGETDEKSGTKKKKKTSNKRKMAAKFPFLDDSVKEAFLKNDWATQMPKLEGSAPISTFDLETKPCIRKMDASTSITSVDTKVLNLINTGNMHILQKIDYPYQICIGRELSIMKGTTDADGSIEGGIPEILHQEKGTMTDSMCVVGLEFLQSSFPSIPEKELKDILEKCDGDVEWAVNLLLDWKYNLNLSEEDSDKFVDCMFKAQHIPKSPILHSSLRQKSMKSVVSPRTLMDMCNDIIVKEHNIDRLEIEQQLIMSSEKRLSSLEKQLSIQAKQYSFSSFGDEVIEEDSEFTDALLKELINSADNKSLSSDSRESSQVSLSDEPVQVNSGGLDTNDANEFWNVDFDHDAKKKHQNKELENVHFDLDVGGMDIEDEEGVTESVGMINRPDYSRIDRDRTDSFGEPTVLLPLKKEFTKALFSLFGPVDGLDTDKEDDLTIPVTLDVAKLMYTCIKTASRKGQVRVHSDQQLMEDEAYARQLQAEEDSEINHHDNRLTGPVNSTPQSFSKPPPPVIGFTIDRGLNLSSPRPKVVSLVEIMDEEQAKEIEKRELVETLQQSGSYSALSTRLKQQKLYDVFPGIDTTVLDDIFQANCYILEDTIKAVQGSLACNAGTPKTVMSKEAEENYEKHLIEAAKQQSLQEMLDSCLHVVHVPKIIKDAQTVRPSVDYEEFRGEANLHYRLRHECFQKAQEAHRRGMRQVASFYSNQGHLHTQKIKDANMRASEQILSTRIDLLEKNSTLDLHGLHVDEAVAAMERILPNKQFELQSNPLRQKQYLIIVTGRGMHSRGGVSKLKPAVMNYLRRNEYRFSEIHEGALRVGLKHRNNT